MFDAGHTHGPTPHFVTDCPLCDAAKEARNRAIAHLNEALNLLASYSNDDDPRPTLRLNLGPIGITGDDIQRCHSIDLTAKQAEALSDAIDSMTACLGSASPDHNAIDDLLRETADAVTDAIPVDPERTARFMGWLQGQSGEAIESGEWSAAAVAQNDPDLYADVTDLFDELDLTKLHKEVCQDRQVDEKHVTQALDAWFGDIEDPELVELYGDEDDV